MTDSQGKVTFYWSDRVREALVAKNKWNIIQRGGDTSKPTVIASAVKTGSFDSMARRYLGYGGMGISPDSDTKNNANHGAYMSGGKVSEFQSTNKLQMGGGSYMVYYRPDALLGKIADYRTGHSGEDCYGTGGNHTSSAWYDDSKKSNSLSYVTTGSKSGDLWVGTGLGAEDTGFVGINTKQMYDKVMKQLADEGVTHIGGRPVTDVVRLISDLQKMSVNDMPPYTPPAGLVPLLSLPEAEEPTTTLAAA